jgi:UDP-2,3-diacylglucosamine hydrolase
MTTLFISDLHLDSSQPELTNLFLEFLQQEATTAEALYILGDLFEVWIGDDNQNPDYQTVIQALGDYAGRGIPLYIMHGNRDFLLGEGFCKASGAQLLEEPSIIDLYGTPTLLLHGDSLCTDDTEHQAFRREVRGEKWQADFLAKSLDERQAIADNLRAMSHMSKQAKEDYIMDVNHQAVSQAMHDAGVHRLIHGHTHRPAIHDLEIDGQPAKRMVLGDWRPDQGSVLWCDAEGCRLEAYASAD